jgi:hypothetical protein
VANREHGATEVVGATYNEYTNLTAPVGVSGDFSGAATAWAGTLQTHHRRNASRSNPDAWAERPKTVTVTSGRGSEGDLVRFVSNWSWEQAQPAMPVAMTDVLSGGGLASGETLHLGAWDVRVLLERPPEKEDEGRPLA